MTTPNFTPEEVALILRGLSSIRELADSRSMFQAGIDAGPPLAYRLALISCTTQALLDKLGEKA